MSNLIDILYGNPRDPQHEVDRAELSAWLLDHMGNSNLSDLSEEVDAIRVLASGIDSLNAQPTERPGDAPSFFTGVLAGEPEDVDPSAGTVVITPEGAALQVPPAGADPSLLAPRRVEALEAGIVYAARLTFRQIVDTADPAGNTVQAGIVWLNKDKQVISEALLFNGPLSSYDGYIVKQTTLALAAGQALQAPANARYFRPFVRSFSSIARIAVSVLRTWVTTGLPGPQGQVGDVTPAAQAARDDAVNAASQSLSVFAANKEAAIITAEAAPTLTVPASLNSIRVTGGAAQGDGGRASYTRVSSTPAHAAYLTDASGAKFELSERRVKPAMFKRSSNTWAQAFNAAAVFLGIVGGGVIDLDARAYTFNAPLVIDGSDITIDAQGARVSFDHNAGPCVRFGTGATQRFVNRVIAGLWVQQEGCNQPLFEIRGLRGFYTECVKATNLYTYVQWGRAADAVASYIWFQDGDEITHRNPQGGPGTWSGGHSHFVIIENSNGAWFQSRSQIEGPDDQTSGGKGSGNDSLRDSACVYFPPTFAPARFDHWVSNSSLLRGAKFGIFGLNARLVNLQMDIRIDDTRVYALSWDATAAGEGIEGGFLHIFAGGFSAGGGVFIRNANATAASGQIDLKLTANRFDRELIELQCSAGTFRDMVISCIDVGWVPNSLRNGILIQQTGGTMTNVTVPLVAIRNLGTTGAAPVLFAGTVTNRVAGTINAIGFSGSSNF